MNCVETVQKELFKLQDLSYQAFHRRLMPTIDSDRIIGVRTPALRKFAGEFAKYPEAAAFLRALPHRYYEENNLHGFLIASMKDYDRVITELELFLPYVDNWATCDMLRPKIFSKHLSELINKIPEWLSCESTFTVRFGIEMLMTYYLDHDFKPEYLKMVAAVQSTEYYVKMMIAWYYATALAKQYDAVLPYFKTEHLEQWTHNKAIQKAIESDRISQEQKIFLRTLKRK